MDPLTATATIGAVLTLIDRFRDLAIKWSGQSPTPPGATVKVDGQSVRIEDHGRVESIAAGDLRLDQWDEVRVDALKDRAFKNWRLFNEIDKELPLAGRVEAARMKLQMEDTKASLCADFRELVRIYEVVLQTPLPDHYQLYEVCG